MKRIALYSCIAAAALMVAAPSLYAKDGGRKQGDRKASGQQCDRMMKMGPGGPMFGDPERMKKELGLTDEQVKKIAGINEDHRKKMLEYREKLAPLEIRLERLLIDDPVDLSKVRALIKEISDLRVEVQMLRIQHRLDIEKVLTKEQKDKMKAHRKHMMGKKGHPHRGHGPEGPPEKN